MENILLIPALAPAIFVLLAVVVFIVMSLFMFFWMLLHKDVRDITVYISDEAWEGFVSCVIRIFEGIIQ